MHKKTGGEAMASPLVYEVMAHDSASWGLVIFVIQGVAESGGIGRGL
jgi:hypothetical protein